MKKRIITFIIVLFAAISLAGVLDATPKQWRQHKKLPGGKKIFRSCASCHNSKIGLKKTKGQNLKRIYRKKGCSGKGCH